MLPQVAGFISDIFRLFVLVLTAANYFTLVQWLKYPQR